MPCVRMRFVVAAAVSIDILNNAHHTAISMQHYTSLVPYVPAQQLLLCIISSIAW